eukprot:4596597-Pyramimonas_sp.AAC.1
MAVSYITTHRSGSPPSAPRRASRCCSTPGCASPGAPPAAACTPLAASAPPGSEPSPREGEPRQPSDRLNRYQHRDPPIAVARPEISRALTKKECKKHTRVESTI